MSPAAVSSLVAVEDSEKASAMCMLLQAASTNLVRLPEKVVQWPVLGSPDRQVVRVFITTHSKYTPTRYTPLHTITCCSVLCSLVRVLS